MELTDLWNKHEYQHSADIFVKNIFNSFYSAGLFQVFFTCIRKTGSLKGGLKVAQCYEMG